MWLICGVLFFPFLINPNHHSKASLNSFWSPERYASCEPAEPTSPGRTDQLSCFCYSSLAYQVTLVYHMSHISVLCSFWCKGSLQFFPYSISTLSSSSKVVIHITGLGSLSQLLSSHRIRAFFIHDCFSVNFWSSPYSSFLIFTPFSLPRLLKDREEPCVFDSLVPIMVSYNCLVLGNVYWMNKKVFPYDFFTVYTMTPLLQ